MNFKLALVGLVATSAITTASAEPDSRAKIFRKASDGIIEIDGPVAKAIYNRLSKVPEKETAFEFAKIGKGIRCSNYESDVIDKNIKGVKTFTTEEAAALPKLHEYKCFFHVDEAGGVTAPAEVK